jgi:hypothetical protein
MVQSPALVGRDDFLTLAERRLAETAAGAGQLWFVAAKRAPASGQWISCCCTHTQQPRLFRWGPDMLVGPVGARWGCAYA